MTHKIETPKYGTVEIRNAMLETGRHDLVDGIEIKIEGEDLIEIHGHYDVEEITVEELSILIDQNL